MAKLLRVLERMIHSSGPWEQQQAKDSMFIICPYGWHWTKPSVVYICPNVWSKMNQNQSPQEDLFRLKLTVISQNTLSKK